MITKRIIPCLDVKDGRVVKGVKFEGLNDVSSPVSLAEFYSKSGADELVFLSLIHILMIKIMDYSCTSSEEIFARGMSATGVEETVAAIIADIKENKDKALFKYCEKFDNTVTDNLEVTKEEIDEAFELVDKDLIEVMQKARDNIYDYHKHQVRNSFVIDERCV